MPESLTDATTFGGGAKDQGTIYQQGFCALQHDGAMLVRKESWISYCFANDLVTSCENARIKTRSHSGLPTELEIVWNLKFKTTLQLASNRDRHRLISTCGFSGQSKRVSAHHRFRLGHSIMVIVNAVPIKIILVKLSFAIRSCSVQNTMRSANSRLVH